MCFFYFSDLFIITNKKKTTMCAKSTTDNLFLIRFLRAMNYFFCLEMINTFSLISCFNNCSWHCLYVLKKQRLLLATLKLRSFGIRWFCWQYCKKCKWVSFFRILKSKLWNLNISLTISLLSRDQFFQNHLIPKLLNFKVASSSLCFLRTYKQCQLQLLKQEIKEKVFIISKQKKEFIALKKRIKNKLSIFAFANICCLFFVGNDKKISEVKETHCKKLKNLG